MLQTKCDMGDLLRAAHVHYKNMHTLYPIQRVKEQTSRIKKIVHMIGCKHHKAQVTSVAV
jgi:hypothetical protein